MHRSQDKSPDGEEKYRYIYPKATKKWVAKPILIRKTSCLRAIILCDVMRHVSDGILDDIEIPTSVPKNFAKHPRPDKELLNR